MIHRLRNRHFFVSDFALLGLAAYLSYVFRLESFHLGPYWSSFWLFASLAVAAVPLAFRRAGVYSRYWRYASIDELLLLTGTVTAASMLVAALALASSYLLLPRYPVPRSIPFIFLLLALATTAGPRLAVRALTRFRYRVRGARRGNGRPVLIIGAGAAGTMIAREMQHNPQLGMDPIGFLDDDPGKRGVRIHGVSVLGDRHALPIAVESHNIEQIIIAMPTVPGKAIREIVALCEQTQVETRIIPGVYELLDGTVRVNQLREVHIDDLLRREPVRTHTDDLRALVRGRRVMVTGGGGSIGSELCRQLARFQPSQLIVLDHGENSVFYMLNELHRYFPHLSLVGAIADVRDRTHLEMLYHRHRPNLVFHAAAHKHVPLMEHNPCEAITNNVLGTRHLVELAEQFGVERFVMISTDKAVNPSSVMGASKRCAERIVHEVARRSGRPYVAVRFGNVLGSSGSVVPLFKQQIAAGGPVTVTHPEMRRFFMTIPEAVQLVLQAAALGKEGEVFVLDMGEPVRIVDLANDLITLSGLRPGEDIEIVFTGVRPGEKLYEELFIKGEQYNRTRHEKIFVVQGASHERDDPTLVTDLDRLILAAEGRRDEAIRPLLKKVVPEYRPDPAVGMPLPKAPAGSPNGALRPRYGDAGG